MSVSWMLQVLNKIEEKINFAFIDRFVHRKTVRAVGNRCAEHFCPQTWEHGSDNVLNKYCSYNGNIYVLIIKEIFFRSSNRKLF